MNCLNVGMGLPSLSIRYNSLLMFDWVVESPDCPITILDGSPNPWNKKNTMNTTPNKTRSP